MAVGSRCEGNWCTSRKTSNLLQVTAKHVSFHLLGTFFLINLCVTCSFLSIWIVNFLAVQVSIVELVIKLIISSTTDHRTKTTINAKTTITDKSVQLHKGNNKITELRTILQRENQNS